MNAARAQAVQWLHQPRCPRCGGDAPPDPADLRSLSFICPHCGEDWYARPPMSYAQREGIPSGALPNRTGLPDALAEEIAANNAANRPHPRGASRLSSWLHRVLSALALFAIPRTSTSPRRSSSRTPGRNR